MSQNPYAQFGGGGEGGPLPYGPELGDQFQPRTSILAISALVVSVIGCLCWPIGPISMILGGLAILVIFFAKGQVKGIGFAATAICLGLLQVIVLAVAFFGIYRPIMGGWTNTVVAPVADVFVAIEKKDAKGARALLTPRAQTIITEDMLTEFAAKYHAKLGTYSGFPDNLWEIIPAYRNVRPALKSMSQDAAQQNIIPIPGMFEKGDALVILQMDVGGNVTIKPTPGPNGPTVRMPVVNIGIITNDGQEIWIIDQDKLDALTKTTGGSGGRHRHQKNAPHDDSPPVPDEPTAPSPSPTPTPAP